MLKGIRMKGNVLYGQSGGPSSVINSSALGVFLEARRQRDKIDKIFVMKNGIVGAIKNQVCEITSQNTDLLKLRHTSGAIFGSSRYKLDDCKIRPAEYLAIVKTLQTHNIRYFFLNGGNDSMDTCNKINNYLQMVNYECRVIGIPKTIDNDLVGIDHSPGYGSSAKFIANLMIELDLDNSSYPMGRVVIVEIMGRNAGWLAASAKLASIVGHGPDLIYVPEVSFDSQSFVDRVKKIYQTKNRVLIAVSEGINYREACRLNIGQTDPFGHRVLGGVSYALASLIKEKLSLETKVINMGMAQRSAARISSLTDIREAEMIGKEAVRQACCGKTGKMITIERKSNIPYSTCFGLADLETVANKEKRLPLTMINKSGDNINDGFIEYALPLIQGEDQDRFDNGLLDTFNFVFSK